MLDGQGADEQLGGYEPFFAARLAGLARRARLATLVRELPALPARQVATAAAVLLLPEPVRQVLRRALRRPSIAEVDWLDGERLGARVHDPFLAAGGRPADVQQLSMAQILYTSLPMLLHWEDRDSMAHSVEARVPFLDYRLVELALGLPEDEKIAGGIAKRVLREAMNGILPEAVRARRDKIGFATAEELWLRRERPDDFRAAMREAVQASQGALRPAALELLEDVITGRRPFSFVPWRMISFGAWMRRFDVRLA
jgi:asparagine synthase (glutamine-hydrolysing)